MGAAKKSAVLSNPTVVIEHLLKLQFSSAADPRGGWIDSVLERRTRLEFDLTPRLRQILQRELARVYEIAAGPRNADWGSTERMSPPTRCP